MDFRVILVRTQFPGNMGSVARVMKNFGFSELVFVAPEAAPLSPEARRMSCQGEEILRHSQTFDTMQEAIAPCVFVAATTARLGGLIRTPLEHSVRIGAQALKKEETCGKIGLVFGPESSGLTTAEIGHCQMLLNIPTSAEYPALNLAQAVAITLHEIQFAGKGQEEYNSIEDKPASVGMQERSFEKLAEALKEIHFLFGPKSETLFLGIRAMIARAKPTEQETKWLHGISRQLLWYSHKQKPPS